MEATELQLRRPDAVAAPAPSYDDDDDGGFAAGDEAAVPLPGGWRDHLTARALAASLLLSVAFGLMAVRLTMAAAGVVPSVNLSASLLAFLSLRLAAGRNPLTPQETAVVQATVASATAVAVNAGFGSYLLAMMVDGTKNPRLGWMISFLFLVSFAGLFVLVPFRKVMIVDYKLTYPTGTATAYLINDLHTPKSDKSAK
uniref:Uncharacterized protein n=1 Tax=Oryza brachyantha TaxID=4533 RepID=J3N9N6_ORYBR